MASAAMTTTMGGGTGGTRFDLACPDGEVLAGLKLHVLVDRSSVEVFANDGRVAMSGVLFPDPENREIQISSSRGSVVVESLDLYEIID